MITIHLNGEPRELAEDMNLAEMLAAFSLPNKLVAIERNGEVVRRGEWKNKLARDGDRIEVVHFVGGG